MQTTLRSTLFDEIEDIDSVQPFSEAHDAVCFSEIAACLSKHNRLGKFVVTLLHTHFDISKNERLVQFADKMERVLRTRVVVDSQRAPAVVPCSWRLSTSGCALPLQYALREDLADHDLISKEDDSVMAEIAAILQKHNKLNRFGLALATDPFDLSTLERLLERTDVASRIQVIKPDAGDVNAPGVIQTSWRLERPSESGMTCNRSCASWCTGGEAHRRIHDTSHYTHFS